MQIVELTGEEGWRRAYSVMHELRTHHSLESFLEAVREMVPRGYRIFAAEDDGEIKAVAGVGKSLNLYYARYLWVYDLVTTDDSRSVGYGARLLSYLEEMARSDGCDTIALSSRLDRKDAHRFYEDKMGYTRSGYTFQKSL